MPTMNMQEHVLIVDDDAAIRNLLSAYIRENGYRVTAVADGRGLWTAMKTTQVC
jgi:two-component system, OmpR family, response regulator